MIKLFASRSKRRNRTIAVLEANAVPEGSRLVRVKLTPDAPIDVLVYWVIVGITLVFAFDSLDTINNSPVIRQWIINSINWGALYAPWLERPWTPWTSEWFHGSWEHLFGNMTGLLIAAWLLTRAFSPTMWRVFFFLAGPLAGIAYVATNAVPAADFTKWMGPLAAITSQPNTPLAGASGGVFAMMGGALAACTRFRLARSPNWLQFSLLQLAMLPVVQFLFVDAGNEGIAGLAHETGLLFGFLIGLIPPAKGPISLLTSKPDSVGVVSVSVDDVNQQTTECVLYLTPESDPTQDFLIRKQDYLGFHVKPVLKLIEGTRPTVGANAFAVPINVRLVRLSDAIYKQILKRILPTSLLIVTLVSGVSQLLFGRYSSHVYPSVFIASFVYGVIVTWENVVRLRKRLDWNTSPEIEPPKPIEISGRWES